MNRVRSGLKGVRNRFRKFSDDASVNFSIFRIRLRAALYGKRDFGSKRYLAYMEILQEKKIPNQKWPLRENVNDYYYAQSVDANKILMVGLGKNVRGSLQVILNELNSKQEYANFEIYVRTSEETERHVCAFIEKNGWSRTKTVTDDREYGVLMETAKYLITEVYFPDSWVKRPEQVSINIWHGTPIKKLGAKKNTNNCHKNGPAQKNFINADYLLYPNDFTREHLLDSYRVSQLMNGRALMLGYPRTGGMLALDEEERQSLRRRLAPGRDKMFVYMPTFRDYLSVDDGLLMFEELLDFLEEKLTDDEILYVNLHHKFSGVLDYSAYTKVRPFPQDLDSYEILAVSDALISDYSSVIFDYLALKKQIVLYVPDYETYQKKRGVYLDIRSLPFDVAETTGEVLAALHAGKRYDDTEAYETFCRYDSSDNAGKLCRLFLGDESSLTLEDIPKNNLKNVLIHTELAEPGERTGILQDLAGESEKKTYNLFFSCSRTDLKPKDSGAYPMFRDYPVIGSDLDMRLSAVTRSYMDLLEKGRFTFKEVFPLLQLDYRLMGKRMIGEASFSVILAYDCKSINRVLALASLDESLLLFLTKDLLDELEAGDEFAREALLYAVKESKGLFAFSQEDCTRAETLLGSGLHKRITLITNAGELDNLIVQSIGGTK